MYNQKKIVKSFGLFVFLFSFLMNESIAQPLGEWTWVNQGTSCNSIGQSGSCPQGRHEGAYVQVGDKFILIGGRESNSNVNIYNPANNSWTIGKNAPFAIHHFQAIEYHGLVLAVGAMRGNCCAEPGVDKIMIYDPEVDEWYDGPAIPADRVRGGAGAVVHQGDIYLVSGNTTGHSAPGWVRWFDKYDPETNTWTRLPDTPRARDHFHVAVVNNKLYVTAGRRSGEMGLFGATIREVDVYDFATNSWTTLSNNLPTERAGNTVAVLNNELLVIGGEKTDASSKVEALNVNTGTWRTVAALNQKRHGMQAIVNNRNVWVATGSPNLGGGAINSQEKFSFDGFRAPILNDIKRSNLNTPSSASISVNGTVALKNTGGTQAILVNDIRLSNSNFQLTNLPALPFILKPNSTLNVSINLSGNPGNAQLIIDHTGKNGSTNTINLSGNNNQLIANGQYFIEATNTGQFVADPSGSSDVSMVAANTSNDAAKWRIEHLGNNTYSVRNLRSNDYLEVPNAQCFNDANVGTWRGLTNDNHKWKISKIGSNYFFQPLHCTSRAMDKNGGTNRSVHLWAFNTANSNQQFKIKAVNSSNSQQLIANGNYNILGANNEYVGTPSTANNNVQMVNGSKNDNRNRWTFIHLGNNEYTIKNIGSDRFLEVPAASCGNGANVATWVSANSNHQKWIISKSNDNRYFLRPKHCTNTALDKNNGNGNNVHLWSFSTSNVNQLFRILPVANGDGENIIVNGAHYIQSKASGQNAIGPVWSGGKVVLSNARTDFNDQRWDFKHLGNGVHYIKNVDSGRFMEAIGAGCGNGFQIGTSTNANNSHQRWFVRLIGDNYFLVPAHCTNTALDKNSGRDRIAHLWRFDKSNVNQQFDLIPVDGGARPRSSQEAFFIEKLLGKKTNLEWHYFQQEDKDIKQYAILHTSESNQDFTTISILSSDDNPQGGNYQFIHETPAVGENYYQIRIEYEDGSYDYTNFEMVYFEPSNAAIVIAPNPAQNFLKIDLSNYMDKKLFYMIVSLKGEVLMGGEYYSNHGSTEMIDLNNFQNGNYIIYIRPEGHREISQQFVIMKDY